MAYIHGENLQLSVHRDFLHHCTASGLNSVCGSETNYRTPLPLKIPISEPNFCIMVDLLYISEKHIDIKLFRVSQLT
jgi:hypothetical protein